MGNAPFEIDQRKQRRLAREVADRKSAEDLATLIIDRINTTVIRPGPKPEERECTEVASELVGLHGEIVALILESE